jgi:hypothetical protein
MGDVTSLVDTIATIEEAAPEQLKARVRQEAGQQLVAIRFAGGSVGVLDVSASPGSVWASVLRNLHELAQPVYVEINPATDLITQVLQPKLQPVGAIEPAENRADMRVEFLRSHSRHFLRRTHPRYAAMLQLLREAQAKNLSVWVTDSLNTHEILDVRPSQTSGGKSETR